MRPVIDCKLFFSHIQLHRGQAQYTQQAVFNECCDLWHSRCDEESSKGDEGIQGNELIIVIYYRICWVRKEEETSVGEGGYVGRILSGVLVMMKSGHQRV